MKRISILGSTGSIGKSALDVVSLHRDELEVAVLTAGNNIDLLEKQIKAFSPRVVAVADKEAARQLQKRIGKRRTPSLQIMSGPQGISDAAGYEGSDFVLSAIVGAAGLIPTLSAVSAGKTIGLANKESLVMAGSIVIREAKKHRVRILPVDSEHSAIFQCIKGYRKSALRRIILTASGGPFFGKDIRKLGNIKPEDALNHPRWKMGKKITIDSATLMNKGFEVIEARYLFGLPPERIDVIVHPESIVHSIVEFDDRSCIAQLSTPDMKGPIAYALTYPGRFSDVVSGLDLAKVGSLTFREPDYNVFPCLCYAYEALKAGGTMPSVLNAANEVAVNAFLKSRIGFSGIPSIIRKTMDCHTGMPADELDAVMEADRWAREKTEQIIRSLA